jgi:hypothetical protein
MKIYHSDLTTDVVLRYKQLQPNKQLRALISYGRRDRHHRDLMLKHRGLLDGLIMDSGTYTLNQNPKKFRETITIGGYKSYMGFFADMVDFYFNFDEDFSKNGFETNFDHQVNLEHAGLAPIPVVHDCYGPEILTYIDRGHKLIAIGSGELKFADLKELYRIVNGIYRQGVKVHFLGCTEFEKLAYIPVYSADSTTWNRTGSAGRIFYLNPNRIEYKKMDKIALDDSTPKRRVQYHIRDYPFRDQLEKYLFQDLKLSIDDLIGDNALFNRALANIHYFVLFEEWVNRKHKEQGFTF